MVKGEIRGLKSGYYNSFSQDGSDPNQEVGLEIKKLDHGTSLVFIDFEFDVQYSWIIDESGKVISCKVESHSSAIDEK